MAQPVTLSQAAHLVLHNAKCEGILKIPCSICLIAQPMTWTAGVKRSTTAICEGVTSLTNMLWTAKSRLEDVTNWGRVQCDMSGSQSAKRQNTRWNVRGWAAMLFDTRFLMSVCITVWREAKSFDVRLSVIVWDEGKVATNCRCNEASVVYGRPCERKTR